MHTILNVLLACLSTLSSDEQSSAAAEQTATTPDLAPVEVLEVEGVRPISRVGNLILAGQPTILAFLELAEMGATSVVDLRKPREARGFDEATLMSELEMSYTLLGFGSPSELDDQLFDEVRSLLTTHRKSGKGDLVLHCASSNRVGAVWLASRVLDEGAKWEAALKEARSIGLSSKGLEERVLHYVTGAGNIGLGKIKLEIRAELPDVARIGVAELAARLKEGVAPLLLDVRESEEYAVSHLPKAQRAVSLKAALAILKGRAKDAEVVVYCSVGYRSGHLADELGAAGFTNVRNLEGSIFEWANTGQAVYRDGKPVMEVHPYDKKWGKLLAPKFWKKPK